VSSGKRTLIFASTARCLMISDTGKGSLSCSSLPCSARLSPRSAARAAAAPETVKTVSVGVEFLLLRLVLLVLLVVLGNEAQPELGTVRMQRVGEDRPFRRRQLIEKVGGCPLKREQIGRRIVGESNLRGEQQRKGNKDRHARETGEQIPVGERDGWKDR